MSAPKIVKGPFALVSSGNCTQSFILDGPDIQERANAALDTYWGSHAVVIERGIKGYGVDIGLPYVEVYESIEGAEKELKRITNEVCNG